MDSRNGNAAAAAALPHQHPHALLALPDLDRPAAVMEMWELEAVATALPAKKRRLREAFDRLAACAPAPLPFRWEDLDTYISSLQYSVTLRHRHLREGPDRPSRPAPAIATAPAPISAAPVPIPHAVSELAATGGNGVRPTRVLEKSRPVHAPVSIARAVSEPAATGDDADKVRAPEEFETVHAPAPAPAAVSAPAATGVDVGKGKKRKASGHDAEAVNVAPRVQEAQVEMRKIHEDAAAKEAASPLQGMNPNGKKSRSSVPPIPADDNGLAAPEPNATARVDPVPVSKIAVVPQELPGPAAAARPATNRATPAEPLQRSRPILRIPGLPASTAVSAAPVSGRQKTRMQDDLVVTKNTPHDVGEAKGGSCRPGRGTGTGNGLLSIAAVTTQANVEPISKIAGVRHESPAATSHDSSTASPPKVASFPPAKVPKQEPQDAIDEVPDVEMEIMEAEEAKREHLNDEVPDVEMEIVETEEMQAFIEDAPVADEEASSPLQAKALEADKVSPLPLACSDGGLAQAGARAATALQEDAAGATVCKRSPSAVTRGAQNVPQASAPKSAGVRTATRDDASDATRLAPAGSQDAAAAEVSPVPPRRGNGLAQSGVSTDDAMQTVGAVAAGRDSPAATRRVYNATDLVPARGRNKATGPPQAMAPPKASNNKHVLQKQHMPKQGYHEPIHPAKKQNHSFSRNNHGGRPAGSQPVPEAQAAAAAQWNKPGEGRGGGPGHGGFASARGGLQGDGRPNKGNAKGRPFVFCNKCGCKGHLAETCRTAKHLVALYQRAMEEREDKQICYRCGCTGHWSRKCHTPKHLVDLYQKDRAAKRAARGNGSPIEQ